MGMSSSQARLLTLTSRLHSIEISAQKIEAEKLRLANDSNRVYENYLNKLEQTKLVASVLADNGSMTDIELTANVIYNYKTLQNQYTLITKDDKMLITESISNNYKNTDSLSSFLNAYGLATNVSQTIHHEDPNPTYENQKQNYENALKNWEKSCTNIDDNYKADYNAWLLEKAAYEESLSEFNKKHEQWIKDHEKWVPAEPDPDDQTQPWWTTTADDSLATKFESAGSSCYSSAKDGYVGCYAHVLAHIIDFSDGKGKGDGENPNSSWYDGTNNLITTTIGTTQQILSSDITNAGMNSESNNTTMAEVSVKLDDEAKLKPKIATGETCNVNASSSDYEKLVSKWDYRTGQLKSTKQWAKDLYYVCKNTTSVNGYNADDFTGTVVKFQEALKNSLTEFNQNIYDNYHKQWVDSEPQEPTFNGTLRDKPTKPPYPPKPKEEDYINANPTIPRDEVLNHTSFTDKDKAQWYINLWYRMEGLNETPKVAVTQVKDDATNTIKEVYSVTNINKSNTTYSTNPDWNVQENDNYIVIPDNKIDDPQWLRNAVVEGYVLIQEFDKENNKFFDTSVSVTTKINEIKDEKGVKKAEAEYEADMKKIDKKDRQYDTELAACETERNAIKEEVDTLKTVAKENVDRTFKLFS